MTSLRGGIAGRLLRRRACAAPASCGSSTERRQCLQVVEDEADRRLGPSSSRRSCRSSSRTTKTLPSSVAASSWATSGSRSVCGARPRRAASRPSAKPLGAAVASDGRRASDRSRPPRSTATCRDLRRDLGQVGERLGCIHACEHTAARGASPEQVLRRPRHAPRRDDRVLRAPLVRAAALPLARAARPRRTRPTRARSSCASSAKTFPSTSLDSILRAVRGDPGERDGARHRRRRVPALVVALVLQRARERVQHRLRPAEPRLPPRQGARDDDDGRLARRPVRVARRRLDRRRRSCKRYFGFAGNASLARVLAVVVSTARPLRLPRVGVLRADERRPDGARGPAGRGRRRR